jgi:uroporphyrinogen-III decarboxylase
VLGGSDVAMMGQGHSGWHMAFQVRGGIDRLLVDMYRESSATRRFMRRIASTCYTMNRYMVDAGVDVLFITDDYADNRLPFMSLDLFRKFELPNLRKVARFARRRGVPLLKHSDGNLKPYMEDMIDAGIRGIHPLEQGAMDLGEGKADYGDRICILGNVDCRYVLPTGSEKSVRSDVRRCMGAAAPGGGYILASSNSIHANCSVGNVRTMVDEAVKSGKYHP